MSNGWKSLRKNLGMSSEPNGTARRRRGYTDFGPCAAVNAPAERRNSEAINMAADDSSDDDALRGNQPLGMDRKSSWRGAMRRASHVLDFLSWTGGLLRRHDSDHNAEANSSDTHEFVQTAVLGEIQFHQGVTQYCITKPQVPANEIFEHLLLSDTAWDLDVPKLVLSVMGGAGKMNMEEEDVASFSKGLVEAALKTSAWVITGGTNSGVMDMVGKAMQKYDKYHQVPCIGITAYGALTRQWRSLLDSAKPSSSSSSNNLDGSETASSAHKDPRKLDLREQVDASEVIDETGKSKDDTGGLPGIQENHTHTILVNNGVTGFQAFASEADLRARLEEFAGKIQLEKSPREECSDQPQARKSFSDPTPTTPRHENANEIPKRDKSQNMRRLSLSRERSLGMMYDPHEQRKKVIEFNKLEVPRVMILVNGGKFSLDHLEKAILHDCPLVVCKGTGRLADCIVTLCESFDAAKKKAAAEKAAEEKEKKASAEKKVAEEASKKVPEEIAAAEAKKNAEEEEQALSDALEKALSFLKPDTLNEDQKAMLHRIVKSELVEIFCSKKERLEDVILRAVMTKKKQGAVLHLLLLAVEWRCTDQLGHICTRFMEEHGDDRKKAIEKLFGKMIECCSPTARARAPAGSDVGSGWGPVVTWLMKTHRKELENFSFDLSEIKWRGLGRPAWTGPEALFIWAIEKEAPESVIEAIWMSIEEPVHACLVGASVCRQTVQDVHSSDSYKDNLAQERLNAIADRFEKVAKILIQDVAVTRGDPIMYLFKSSGRWEGNNCFRLAHTLECKLFVSSGVYKNAVDLYWMTPVPFDVTKKPLDPSFLHWQKLLGGLVCEICALFSPWKLQEDQEEDRSMTKWEVWSVPRVKALTHGLSRVVFLIIYSLAVFTGNLADGHLSRWELVLFLWGLGYALVEVKQCQQKPSYSEYFMDFWNFLDSVHISVLLVALTATIMFGDSAIAKSHLEYCLEFSHAMNLLPSYLRALQSFQLSEYFGILLKTVHGMCKDALYFFALLVVFCLAFSSALTPLLWPENNDRWRQGVFWAFWSIFGEVDDAKAKLADVEPWQLRYLAHSLLYLLSLISNTLLANLLIALMNNTYEEKKNASELEWAFNRVDAVLEFNEGADLPPPLNLLEHLLELIWEKCGWTRSDSHRPEVKKQRLVGCSSKYLQDAQKNAMQLAKREEEENEDKLSTRSLQAPMDDSPADVQVETSEQKLLRTTESLVQELRTSRDDLKTERDQLETERDELKRRVAELESVAAEKDKELTRARHQCEMQVSEASPPRNLTLPAPLDTIVEGEQPPLSREKGQIDPLSWTPPSRDATSDGSFGQ